MAFDDDGFAIPGTWAITLSHLMGYKVGGEAAFSTESAVCDECGGWASSLWIAGETKLADSEWFDSKVSRVTRVIVYTCPEHSDTVRYKLSDQYGFASNSYGPDELATAVWKNAQQLHVAKAEGLAGEAEV